MGKHVFMTIRTVMEKTIRVDKTEVDGLTTEALNQILMDDPEAFGTDGDIFYGPDEVIDVSPVYE